MVVGRPWVVVPVRPQFSPVTVLLLVIYEMVSKVAFTCTLASENVHDIQSLSAFKCFPIKQLFVVY